MKPDLPKNLVQKSIEILGDEMNTENFYVSRKLIWDSLESYFNNNRRFQTTTFIEGIVSESPKFHKNGSVTLSVKDRQDHKITIYCPRKSVLKNHIEFNSVVGIKGKFNIYRNSYFDDVGTVQFLAEEVFSFKQIRTDIKELDQHIRNNKVFKKIKFFRKKNISIALVTSEGSEARKDVKNNIGDFYNITEYFVNLFDVEDITSKLNMLKDTDYDIIMLSRGGTEKLEVFNSYSVVNELFKSDKIIITALGHASFKSLSDLVADYSYDAPSAAAKSLFYMRKEYLNKRNQALLILFGVSMISYFVLKMFM